MEFDKLNCVYEVIHDLYHFGLMNDYADEDLCMVMDYKVGMFIEWIHDNLNPNDYENLFSYFCYLPIGHGCIPKVCHEKYGKVANNLYDENRYKYSTKRKMIVPFKYLKNINGTYPLESVYNDVVFKCGGTEELLYSYKKLCEAYKYAEWEYVDANPDKEHLLFNHNGFYNEKKPLHVKNDTALLRILCWWDVYGRLTGKTTDLNYIDVSKVRNFSFAFSSTSRFLSSMPDEYKGAIFKLLATTVWKYDISGWKPDNVREMGGMFRYAKYIPDCISEWDVSKVTDMSTMFMNAQNVPDISRWNVGNVQLMYSMFESVKNIPDISGWDVRNVFDMRNMFLNVGYIPDISGWKTESLQYAINMFSRANITADLSDWDVSNVFDFTGMFEGAVFKIDTDFSKWNMKNAKYLSSMFKYSRGHLWVSEDDEECYGHGIFGMVKSSNIITMDIAAWDVSNVVQMNEMFLGSDFSADISKWDVSKVEYAADFDVYCEYPHTNPKFKYNCFV